MDIDSVCSNNLFGLPVRDLFDIMRDPDTGFLFDLPLFDEVEEIEESDVVEEQAIEEMEVTLIEVAAEVEIADLPPTAASRPWSPSPRHKTANSAAVAKSRAKRREENEMRNRENLELKRELFVLAYEVESLGLDIIIPNIEIDIVYPPQIVSRSSGKRVNGKREKAPTEEEKKRRKAEKDAESRRNQRLRAKFRHAEILRINKRLKEAIEKVREQMRS